MILKYHGNIKEDSELPGLYYLDRIMLTDEQAEDIINKRCTVLIISGEDD